MRKLIILALVLWMGVMFNSYGKDLYPRIVKVIPQDFPKITTYVTFYDESGNPVPQIEPIDFEVYEKVRIKPDAIYKLPVNLSVALLIDKSASMRRKLRKVKLAAGKFIDFLSPNDRIMAMAFDRNYYILRGFSSNKWRAKDAINSLRAKGPTALYDALIRAIIETDRESNTQKCVVVLTDGKDETRTGSRRLSRHSLRDVIALARKAEIPIYTIGLGNQCDKAVLRKIAYYTGGEFYYSPTTAELEGLYQQIANHIKYQYKIVYTSPIPNPDINVREISVKPIFGRKIYRVVEEKVPLEKREYLLIDR
jgi:Ca-activated chloride channel family protein